MNKKQIIQVVIIVAAFAGAGIVLYNGLFKTGNNNAALLASLPQTAQQTPKDVLPYGATLDWSVLKKQNLNYNQIDYPKLDPNSDFGVPVDNLITSVGTNSTQ